MCFKGITLLFVLLKLFGDGKIHLNTPFKGQDCVS